MSDQFFEAPILNSPYKGRVGNPLVFCNVTTTAKRTRSVPIHPKLREILEKAQLTSRGYLFPGRGDQRPITCQACDLALRKACDRLVSGYNTHRNHRTWATQVDKAGVRLKIVQDWGHHWAVVVS